MVSVSRGILHSEIIDILGTEIRGTVKFLKHEKKNPSLDFVTCAAALAHHGLLGAVDFLRLGDVDLSTVPAKHLVSLVSSVTKAVTIHNVTGCDLVTLIDSLTCKWLRIGFKSLGKEETQALVRAMESRVDDVYLDLETLDIEALAEYSGQGCCSIMKLSYSTSDKFFDDLRTWANRKNWLLHFTTDHWLLTNMQYAQMSNLSS